MGDGISIVTNVSKVGQVSRLQQGQQTPADQNEQIAKQADRAADRESVLLKNIDEAERIRVKRRREERRRKREEARKRRGLENSDDQAGRKVDFKA